jgi:protein transport protein SEC61 subunit gamma-like protein
MDEQVDDRKFKTKVKTFLIECRRVWQVTKKPSKSEYKAVLKVTALGILVIGFIGFLISLLWQLVLR